MSDEKKNPPKDENLPKIILYCHLFQDENKGIIQTIKIKLGEKRKSTTFELKIQRLLHIRTYALMCFSFNGYSIYKVIHYIYFRILNCHNFPSKFMLLVH